jgi:hypothetical protein
MQRRTGLMLTGDDIELKAVPGAGDDAASELAFAKRATLVRADPVEGVQRSINIEQRDDSLAGDVFPALAWCDFPFGGNADPVWHW